MLAVIFLTTLFTAGGFALTYLFAEEKRFLWRIAAGNIVGSALFGTLLFASGIVTGFEIHAVIFAAAFTFLPAGIFLFRNYRAQLLKDWIKATGRLTGANRQRYNSFAFYAIVSLLMIFFFGRAMYETPEGIFTGASQNLGDLPFHLGLIFSFADGANFPPMNPNFSGTKLAYPFIADLITAASVKLGADVREAMLFESVTRAIALAVLLESFVSALFQSRPAARLAVFLLFLSGGLGFVAFLSDAAGSQSGLYSLIWNLPRDYTIGDDYRWGNALTTLFITQRGFLLGLPLTLLVIDRLKDLLLTPAAKRPFAAFAVGILSGTLVLIHLHSLFALFIIAAVWTLLRPRQFINPLALGIGTATTALPELIWALSGTASNTSDFFGFHLWWDSRGENPVIFWLRNTGAAIPLCIAGLVFAYRKKETPERTETSALLFGGNALRFYLPFALIFAVSNCFKFAPWEWDNIKILFYWYVGSVPFIAYAIVRIGSFDISGRLTAVILTAILIFSGALDVWRTISGQIKIRVFPETALEIASRIKAVTPKNALFLNAPTYNSAIVLTGRQSFIRYPGHLASHGINYAERERDTQSIYGGGPLARHLLEKYKIDYVLISPEERTLLQVNERFFAAFPLAAEIGDYKIYKVR